MAIDAWLPSAISVEWPTSPKPVTSVQACTASPNVVSASAARLFSVVIDRTAAATSGSGARLFLIAVPQMPVPSGFVRINRSPTRAPALVHTRSASTRPVTA